MVSDGSILDVGDRELRIAAGGVLNVQGGTMTLIAGSLVVAQGGMLLGNGNVSARGGVIEAHAGQITIQGSISAVGAPGGRVELTADAELSVTGTITASAQPGAALESGGDILLTARTMNVAGSLLAPGGSSSEEGPLGGTITLTASGDLIVSSLLDARGAEGGFIELFSGTGSGAGGGAGTVEAGNITVARTAQVLADSSTASGDGGDIEMDANGDGTATGFVFIEGLVSTMGRPGSATDGGGSGGSIDITASADVILQASATLDARGGGPDGCGGMIDVTTASGGMDSSATIIIRSNGVDAEAGALSIDVNGDVTLRGNVDGIGGSGGGGEVTIDSFEGEVNLLSEVNVDSNTAGGGGAILVGSFDEPLAVVVRGALRASGNGAGSGGSIDLFSRQTVQINARLFANGGNSGGQGGTICLSAAEGSVIVDGRLQASGSGPNSTGGTLSVDAQSGISVLQEIDARAQGGNARFCRIGRNACEDDDDCAAGDACATSGGGRLDFTATGGVDLLADVLASSTAGAGGRVEVRSEGDVRISGNVATDGAIAPGGVVEALGCSVIVCGLDAPVCPAGTGRLNSLGPSGTNRLVGRGRVGVDDAVVTVLGSMRADQNGGNILGWSGTPAAFRPAVIVPQNVTPTAREEIDVTLLPCPVCGNGLEEDPETCDDGNQEDGDGCSSICQIESTVVPGDVNGDRAVNDADVCDLITEIFDGDGDSVGSVSGRMSTFPGRPGADANGDTRINAADVTRTIRLRESPSQACAPCLGALALCQ
jgi:cysteine-rich repeat protein